ncbi:hypothetical protein HN789_05800 [archaeon]|jgi:hypothetical protein|nr:hypothetical protein [archaeon]MBT4022287.1 hypothetical protein [archaeon]MBT4271756.1 hypothetical protein [archaeon]MBT4461400.1 hypothetical protein [archaeon]MBT4858656.1 hypothetical protein [archaeon]
MFEEKILTCVDCGNTVVKLVLENSDNSNYLCPVCELGEMDFDDD